MSKNRKNKDSGPIQLAGMLRQSNIAQDGRSVIFGFESQGGVSYRFSCPHEAISEIVENLELLAEHAWKVRGSPDAADIVTGAQITAKARTMTGFRISLAKEGVVLSLVCGPLTHQVLLSPNDSNLLGESILQGREGWQQKFRQN